MVKLMRSKDKETILKIDKKNIYREKQSNELHLIFCQRLHKPKDNRLRYLKSGRNKTVTKQMTNK